MLITIPVAIAMVQAVADSPFAPGVGTASLSLYTGPVPASAAAALDVVQNLHVCSFEFEAPMFGPAAQIEGSGAVEAVLSMIPAQEALEAGDITFFRIYGTDGEPTHQGEVSENMADAMGKLIVNQKTVTVGAEVSVLRLVIGTNID
ncbi:MAG: hypothetical protein E6R03_12820 [Hyphomicrobiaceae bacterium]|nr:MAG: hypothetical protein E6R03_12820 [Hyphomicrobiaceae bacterium]